MIKTRINNEYKDIIKIFCGGSLQKEITKVWSREANKYVYESEVEYTGTLPITINADGSALLDYRIYGNTVQDGTPTPEAPVDVVGCGVETENLYDYRKSFATDVIAYNEYFTYYLLALQPNTTYTAYTNCESKIKQAPALPTTTFIITPDEIQFSTVNGGVYKNMPMTFTTQNSGLVKVGIRVRDNSSDAIPIYQENDFANGEQWLMLNTGSTALPYEPYGYKLPILSNSTVTNIYLGEAETTRKIKKLVLTGEENWTISATWKGASTSVFYIISSDIISIFSTAIFILSDRFKAASRNTIYTEDSDMIARTGSASITIRVSDSIATTIADFKAYLASQYAAGTPVTVWYVLAEPETGIVNEPLMKIGDYADTLSMEQADVSIPTFTGTTVIDYDGEPKPSQMYIKYRR